MSVKDPVLQSAASQALPGTPQQDGFFMPAEWAKQDAVWMLWPYRQDNWHGKGIPAQQTFAKVAEAISRTTPVFMGSRRVYGAGQSNPTGQYHTGRNGKR